MDVFDDLTRTARPWFLAAAVQAARSLGILDALAEPHTPAQLAEHLALAPRRLQALLEVLRAAGVVRRDAEGRLKLGRLPPDAPPVPPFGWGRLAEVLRDDRPLPDETSDPAQLARYQAHLARLAAPLAPVLWTRLGAHGRLLDLGCGHGAWTEAWLADPRHRATCVDLPEVLALARERLAACGDRVAWQEAEAPLPPAHDVALLCNVLHLHGEAACRALIRRVVAALRPGGLLVVKDVRRRDDGPPLDAGEPGSALLFHLNLALYTAEGGVHSPEVLYGWLKDAGLTEVRELPFPEAPTALVLVGHRPEQA